MTNEASKAVKQAIREVKKAVTAEKHVVISAVQNDLSVDTHTLNATTTLLHALERALDIYEKTPARRQVVKPETLKVRRGGKHHTPSKAFARPMLEALHEMGGEAVGNDVLDEVAKRLPLKPADFQPTQTRGQVPRWRNAAMWVRYELTQRGLIQLDPNKKGNWILTPQGEKYLEDYLGDS